MVSRFRRGLTFSELAVGLLFVAIAALACLSPAQSDTFWALRAGEDIWRTGRVPLVDAYSYTAAGRPWPNHEWLWQAIIYGLHRVGGFPLVALFASAVVTSAYALAFRTMVGGSAVRLGLLAVVMILGVTGWSLRPQIVSLFMVALLLWLISRGRLRWIPPLFLVWANAHGGVVMGGMLMVVLTLGSLVVDRTRTLVLALVTVGAGGATLLTPLGLDLWGYVVSWAGAAQQTGVTEWSPFSLTSKEGGLFAVLAAAFVVAAVRGWRLVPLWPDRALVLLAIALLPLAARSARNVSPFLVAALPAASRLCARRKSPANRVELPSMMNAWGLLAAALVAGVAVVACWVRPLPRLGWRPIVPAAVVAIEGCGEPVYNSYDSGGALLWFLPEHRVFIDSRHDPYPAEFVIADRLVEQGHDFRGLFDRYGFKCAVVAADARLAVALREAAWRTRYGDSQWVVLEPP